MRISLLWRARSAHAKQQNAAAQLRVLRGPLGWALAAGMVIAACGGTAAPNTSPGASSAASTGPRIGSFDRPIVLAFTPSQEAATIATNGAAIKSALEKATGLAWKVTTMSSYAAQVEGMCAGQIDVEIGRASGRERGTWSVGG